MALDLTYDPNEGAGSDGVDLTFDPAYTPKKQNKGILGDIGTGLKRGVEQMPGMVTGIADIVASPISAATGINRPFSRGADWLGEQTGFQPGKWAEDAAQEYSPEMQQSLKNVQDAKGFLPTIGAIAENPRSAVNLVAESLPSTLAGGILARGAMGAVAGAENLAAMKAAGDTAGLLKAGAIAGGIGEGVVTAGNQMAQTDYAVDPLKAAGAAVGSGITTGLIGAGSGRLASSAIGRKLGLADIETSIAAGTFGQNAAKAGPMAYAKRIGAGAVQEGLIEEAPQSYSEQVWQNLANGKPWNEGAAEAAAQGAVAGGVMGGGINAIPRFAGDNKAEEAPPIAPLPKDSITLITDTTLPLGHIDKLLNIGNKPMTEAQKAQYAKDLNAAFGEVVGYAAGKDGLEVPVTMEDYLRSTVAAADIDRNKQAPAQEQPAPVAEQAAPPEIPVSNIPVVGPLSKIGNAIDQAQLTQQAVADQSILSGIAKASPAQPEKTMTEAGLEQWMAQYATPEAMQRADMKTATGIAARATTQSQPTSTAPLQQTATNLTMPGGIARAAKPAPLEQKAPQANDAQVGPVAATAQGASQAIDLISEEIRKPSDQRINDLEKAKSFIAMAKTRLSDSLKRINDTPTNSLDRGLAELERANSEIDVVEATIIGLPESSGSRLDKLTNNLSSAIDNAKRIEQIIDGRFPGWRKQHLSQNPQSSTTKNVLPVSASVPVDKNGKIAPGFDGEGGNIASSLLRVVDNSFSTAVDKEIASGRLDAETGGLVKSSFSSGMKMEDIRRLVEARGYTVKADGSFLKNTDNNQQKLDTSPERVKETPKNEQVQEVVKQSLATPVEQSANDAKSNQAKFSVSPIVEAMIGTAYKSADEMRSKISNVKYGDIVDGVESINFSLNGKQYSAKMTGRNRDFVLAGNDSETDRAYALRALLDGGVTPTAPATHEAKKAANLARLEKARQARAEKKAAAQASVVSQNPQSVSNKPDSVSPVSNNEPEQSNKPEIVKVKDVYGNYHHVLKRELDAGKTLLRLHTKDGERKTGEHTHLNIGNIDSDGSKTKEAWKDVSVVAGKSLNGLNTRSAIVAEINRLGQSQEDFDIKQAESGVWYATRKKDTETEATKPSDAQQKPAEPVAQPKAEPAKAQEPATKEKTPVFENDVPNESWLNEQIDYAKSKPRDEFGVPYMGKTTGYFKGATPTVSVDALASFKGERGEQGSIRKDDLDWLVSELKANGLKNVGIPYVEVGYDGVPWVSEGNHRIMAAKQLGWKTMPVEIRYFDGGERNAGSFAPNAILVKETKPATVDAVKQPETKAKPKAAKPPVTESAKDMLKTIRASGYPFASEIGNSYRPEVRVTINSDDRYSRFDVVIERKDGAWEVHEFSVPEFSMEIQADGMRKFRDDLAALNRGEWPETKAAEQEAKPVEPPKQYNTMADIDSAISGIYDGAISPEDYKAAFRGLLANKEAIVGELNKLTKDKLLGRLGPALSYRLKTEKKDAIVDGAFEAIRNTFALRRDFGPNSYSFGAGAYAKYQADKLAALTEMVEASTAEDLKAFADEIAGDRNQRKEKIEAAQDPKTIEDFDNALRLKKAEGMTFAEARMSLTPEQRAEYDRLKGIASRDQRQARADQQKDDVRVASQTTGAQIVEGKHSKKGHKLWSVQLADRVDGDSYKTLLSAAKKMGGNYVNQMQAKMWKTVWGFQFTDEASAEAFMKLAAGDKSEAVAKAQERRDAFADDKSQSAVERLNEMADRLEEKADESLGRERKANTERRARFAASAENAANAEKAMATTMRRIADAIENGTAQFLDRVRQKAQIEYLASVLRTANDKSIREKYPSYVDQEKHRGEKPTAETADYAEFPQYSMMRSDLANLARQMIRLPNMKMLGQRILKVADDTSTAYNAFAKEHLPEVSRFGKADGSGLATFSTMKDAERSIAVSNLEAVAVPMQIKRGEYRIVLSPSEAINRGIWKGDDRKMTLSPDIGAEIVEKLGRLNRKVGSKRGMDAPPAAPWQFENAYNDRKRLSGMGIEQPWEFRAALREFASLKEAPKERDKIKEMERAMIGRKNDGLDFFPTPEETAKAMIDVAEITEGMSVLEPSAGMGHIAEQIRNAGVDPDVIEFNSDRRELLEAKGFNVVGSDFMDLTPRTFTFGDVFRAPDGTVGVMRGGGGLGSNRVGLQPLDENGKPDAQRSKFVDRDSLEEVEKRGYQSGYDRIVMNPPFSGRRDAEHVQHAYSLLRPGGRMVAIMGEGVFFGQDKKAQQFRDWLDDVGGTSEKLEEGTFLDPSLPVNTATNARMVVIQKPETDQGTALYSKSAVIIGDSGLGKVEIKPATSIKPIADILAAENATQVVVKGGNVDALNRVAKLFGKQIIFFRTVDGNQSENGAMGAQPGRADSGATEQSNRLPEDGYITNGFVNTGRPDTVFLNVDSSNHLLYILGHELGHTLRMDDPKLWASMAKQLQPLIRRWSQYKANMGQSFADESANAEELFGDIIGQNFLNQEFWNELAQENQSLFQKIASTAIKILNKAMSLIAGKDVSIYVSDMKQARAVIAKTMAQYAENKGMYQALANQYDGDYINKRSSSIDNALGNLADQHNLSPADKAIYGMVAEGKSASDILKFIASTSRNPFYRQLAKLLQKTGIAPQMTLGEQSNWKMNAGNDKKYAAAYDPKTNTVALFRAASSERHALHELMHAATIKALAKNGLASAQMKMLFSHVKRSGSLTGQYGMTDIDEFVAEAFSNPKFQELLKQVAAPTSSTSTIKSAWNWFVNIVRGILGIPKGQENALSKALEIGLGVMRENMRLNDAQGSGNVRAMPDKTTASGRGNNTPAPEADIGEAKKIKGVPSLNPDEYEVARGNHFWELSFNGARIDTNKAGAGFLTVSIPRKDVASTFIARAIRHQDIKDAKKSAKLTLENAYEDSRELVDSAHKVRNITFTAMPVANFNAASSSDGTAIKLHKSANYNRQQSSEYKLIMVNGQPAYARKANHWGVFFTNIKVGDSDAPSGEEGDQFGRVGSRRYEWKLSGGNSDAKVSQAGYVLLSDLVKQNELTASAGSDADIRYNIADDIRSHVPPMIQKHVSLAFDNQKSTSWLTAANTQYHKALKWAGEGKPLFKRVFDLGQEFVGDVSRFAVMSQNAAPTMFNEWKSVGDVATAIRNTRSFKDLTGKNAQADIDAAAKPLFDGTLYGGGNPMNGVKFSDAKLRSEYKLTDKQIKLYHEALAAVNVSMDELAKSIIAKHAKNNSLPFDNGMSVEDMAESVSDGLDALREEALMIDDQKAADLLEKTMADVKSLSEKNQKLQDAGYFPLMRFGDHTVTATDAEGKVQYFNKFEGVPLIPKSAQYQANREAAKLKAEHPEWTVRTGIQNTEAYKMFGGLNIDALKLFADHMDAESKAPYQEFLRVAVNERSVMKRMMHRKGTPGYSEDVRRTLASFIVSNARAASSNYHLFDMRKATVEAEKDGGDIGQEAVKLFEEVSKPTESATKLRGFLFFNYLGGSIASAAINMTQIPMMTFPKLSQYAKVNDLVGMLGKSAKMAVMNPANVPGEIGKALRQAELDGVTAPQEIFQLTGTAANSIFTSNKGANFLLQAWGKPFALAESFNRRTTFLAAYQIASKMTPAQLKETGAKSAFEFAETMVKETQGIYNAGNRPNIGRGAVGATMMTFKQYSIMYMELLSRLPLKQQAMMLGMLLLAAGAGGLPFEEDAEDIIDTIGQWMGYATNTRKSLRNAVEGAIGKTAADVALNGVMDQMGLSLSARMGMHNLLPGSGILKQSSVDKGRDVQEFFGPAASVIASFGKALENLATGHPDRAALAMAPVAVQNAVRGLNMMNTGYAEDMKGRRTIPVSGMEGFAKSIGFNPKSVAQFGEIKRDLSQDQRLMQVRRESFTSAMADAIISGDMDARNQAISDMKEWNLNNPNHRVMIDMRSVAQRVRAAKMEGVARFLKSTPKTMRAEAIEEFSK